MKIALMAPAWSYSLLAEQKKGPFEKFFRRDVTGQGVLPFLGIHRLAAEAEIRGHQVLVDEGYGRSPQEQYELIASWRPDIIGFSISTALWSMAKILINRFRSALRSTRIAVGGPHAELGQELLFEECPGLDAVFIGPAEGVFCDWVESDHSMGAVPACFRGSSGLTTDRAKLSFTAIAIRTASRINWRCYIPNAVFLDRFPFATSFTSTGCPHRCSFCSMPAAPYGLRFREIEEILAEMHHLDRNLKIRTLNFVDDEPLFVEPSSDSEELLMALADCRLRLGWSIYLNRFDIPSVRIDQLKKAGCRKIYVIADSGVEHRIAEVKGRPVKLEDVERTIRLIHEKNIDVGARFQFGLPGETYAEALETIRFACSLPLDFVSFLGPLVLPGSRIASMMKTESLPAENRWSYYGKPFQSETLTNGDVERLIKTGIWKFYGRLRIVLRSLLRPMRTLRLLRRVALDGVHD